MNRPPNPFSRQIAARRLCAAAAVWATTYGEAVWLTVLLATLGAANLLTAGLILRGEARR